MILLLAAFVWFVALLIALMRRAHSDAWRDGLAIGGIGAKKLERYGTTLLELLRG